MGFSSTTSWRTGGGGFLGTSTGSLTTAFTSATRFTGRGLDATGCAGSGRRYQTARNPTTTKGASNNARDKTGPWRRPLGTADEESSQPSAGSGDGARSDTP